MKKTINKYFWLIGFASLFGLLGIKGDPTYLLMFSMIAFFGYYWGNKVEAKDAKHLSSLRHISGELAFRLALLSGFIASFILAVLHYYFNINFETAYRIQLAIFSLTLGLGVFLWPVLMFHYNKRRVQ